MRYLKYILTISAICAAYIGDYVVFNSKWSNSLAFRAISDSIIHGSLGLLSALIFFSHDPKSSIDACAYNVIFCTFVSSLIDIDHVFVARSFSLKDLTSLNQRGILHCTTFWVLMTVLLILYSFITKKLNLYLLSYMLILAFTSHHLRDGNRRGLWLYPFGSSPALSKNVYILILSVIPHVLAYMYSVTKVYFYKNVVVDYKIIV